MNVLRLFDPWSSPLCTCPRKYSLSPYNRCSHMCLYCYATSYMGRGRSVPKRDFIGRLRRDMRRFDPRLVVSMSNSSDPYPPEERDMGLTRKAIEMLLARNAKIQIVTKSVLFLRDLDLLVLGGASVSVSIGTLDDRTAKITEPGAPSPSERIDALARASEEGIPVSARIDPVIPLLTDDPASLRELVRELSHVGVRHIVTSTYKARPDNLARMCSAFPDLCPRWRRLYVEEGSWFRGYWYLERGLRARILLPVVDEARRQGLTYATCREGLTDERFFRAPTCDGTHLVLGPR